MPLLISFVTIVVIKCLIPYPSLSKAPCDSCFDYPTLKGGATVWAKLVLLKQESSSKVGVSHCF